eukprot:scaffold96407_cov60-Phaeocystis_antarctica.AAC.2
MCTCADVAAARPAADCGREASARGPDWDPLPSPRREPALRPAAAPGGRGGGALRPEPCAVRAVAPRAAAASAAAMALPHPRARIGRAPAPGRAHG